MTSSVIKFEFLNAHGACKRVRYPRTAQSDATHAPLGYLCSPLEHYTPRSEENRVARASEVSRRWWGFFTRSIEQVLQFVWEVSHVIHSVSKAHSFCVHYRVSCISDSSQRRLCQSACQKKASRSSWCTKSCFQIPSKARKSDLQISGPAMKQRCDDEPTTTTTNDLRIGRRHLDGVIWTAAFGQRHSESMPGENRESKQNRPVRGKLTRRLFGNGMIS